MDFFESFVVQDKSNSHKLVVMVELVCEKFGDLMWLDEYYILPYNLKSSLCEYTQKRRKLKVIAENFLKTWGGENSNINTNIIKPQFRKTKTARKDFRLVKIRNENLWK